MFRKRRASWAFISPKSWVLLAGVLSIASLTSCDRGGSAQIEGARNFADAVSRNDKARRDTLIATHRFQEYFQNDYVESDMMSWFRTFYDYQSRHFHQTPSVDVDRDLRDQLQGGLIDTSAIEETGIVKVKPPTAGEEAAVFWMVRQHGHPWKVAIVTKGEMQVNFH
jgi:hypothetical protein